MGACFAANTTLWSHFKDHDSWTRTLISSAIAFPYFTLFMYFATRNMVRAREQVLEGASHKQRRAVLRAARTGKPAANFALQVRAVALVEQRIADHARHPVAPIVTYAVAMGLSVLAALTDGWWNLVGTALFGWLLIGAVRYPGKLRRRLASLQTHPRSQAPPAKTRV